MSSQQRMRAHTVSSQCLHAGSTDAKTPAKAPYTAACITYVSTVYAPYDKIDCHIRISQVKDTSSRQTLASASHV